MKLINESNEVTIRSAIALHMLFRDFVDHIYPTELEIKVSIFFKFLI